MMKYFDLNGKEVSRLGFGCMRLPVIDKDNSKIDKEKASELILAAIDKGLNYIDTAYNYHGKMSEKFVGEFLEEHNLRDKVNLTTKNPVWLAESKEDFYKLLEEQLSNLRTDHLDFYLLHSLSKDSFYKAVELGVLDFAEDIKKRGLVKNIGFSFHDEYEVFEEIIKAFPWDFCQIQLNYLDIDYQAGLKGYELAKSMGIPMVIMEPLKGGRLSNPPEEIASMVKSFEGLSPSQMALKFPLSLDNVMTVLSGMNEMVQVEENTAMADKVEANKLSQEEKDFYKKARDIYKSKEQIACTACEYCMPCTVDINIPRVFALWNNAFLYDEGEKSRESYKTYLEKGVDPQSCIECGKCEGICPQGLEIIEGLKEADQYLR